MKKLSDEEIISRGPAPAKKPPSDNPSVLALLAISIIVGGGFAAGAIIGASMAVAGSMGFIGFISGLATGAVWGGITGAGLIGAMCGVGALFDSRADKKDLARNHAYEAAMTRKRAAEKPARPSSLPEKGLAKKAFSEEGKEPAATADTVVAKPAAPAPT